MDLDVARVEFGQMLQELRAMAILRVDQQIVFIGQWLARQRIDWVGPHDEFGLIVRPAVLGD